MKLVLAEKPSVAQSIAKVIGANKRNDGYVEGNGYIVSWCIGHLVELAMPESYDEKYKRWRYEDLPILPEEWKYQISSNTKKQFGIIKKLMDRKDVESLVCATDAGREGELIFRLVYMQCKCKKPFERLWISSMEDSAIREGFETLKAGHDYDALYKSALCRERADWIVGMNGTRLFSTIYNQTLHVGRVMTPTLAMIVQREREIREFQSERFYTISIQAEEVEASGERIKVKEEAEKIRKVCKEAGTAFVSEVKRNRNVVKPPQLFDLTTLQREANKLYGFSAKQTLDYTQSLYEKKLVTYPRTDSRYLTEDMKDTIPTLKQIIHAKYAIPFSTECNAAPVINNKKVSDHHAIIPTQEIQKVDFASLPSGEEKILKLIASSFLSALDKGREIDETEVKLLCGGYEFCTKVKVVIVEGYKKISEHLLGKEKENFENGDQISTSVIKIPKEGETIKVRDALLKEGKTTAPKRFTEDTLLCAMEKAGSENISKEVERKGIGTPATRAGTIEKLVHIGFIERQGEKKRKYLAPTDKGKALIAVIPEQLRSTDMTAEWENSLLLIGKKAYEGDVFMKDIEGMIITMIQNYKADKATFKAHLEGKGGQI